MCRLCTGAAPRELKDMNGRTWRFEWHRFCGPIVLRADGEPKARQPGSRSPFWPALKAWHVAQGLGAPWP